MGIIFTPLLALIITGFLIYNLQKRTDNRPVTFRLLFRLYTISYVLNTLWEVIQSPLYRIHSNNNNHLLFCLLAAIADAIMTVLLYFSFVQIYKNLFWFKKPGYDKLFLLVLTGGSGALLSELIHISLKQWSYKQSMPLIPLLNVGLVPVLQFILLPGITYYFALKNSQNPQLP